VEGATVLVVDDDPDIRETLRDLLVDEGYRVELARNGRETIERIENGGQLPDAMLLDLAMPEIDGYGVLDHLRSSLLQEFPVLIISAQRPQATILRALDSELRDFIAKPFDLEELLIRLQRLMRRSPRLETPTNNALRVYALGSLRVYRDTRLIFDESWRNKPAKTIFKLLFTHRGQRYPKDVLLEELWPETDPGVASNRLRVAVHELRKMLSGGGKDKSVSQHIGQQEGSYYFDSAVTCWSDVDSFERYIRHAREMTLAERSDEALQAYRSAEALYQGDFLRDDPFFEWSISTRERLRESHLNALSDAAVICASQGIPDEAAGFCRKILRIEPWRETVYRRLMEYLVLAGRPYEALRVYEDCRRVLQAEIEAEPSVETRELRERIAAELRGDGADV
jgi:two-component SAPR family response regulator